MQYLLRGAMLALLYLISRPLPAVAQRPLLRHFTTKDGLASNVIYDIYHDSKGFIWFSTDRRLSCFDGTRFRNYSINEGLPDNEVFSLYEDGFGRYWVVCYNHKACYLKGGRIYTSATDTLCRQIEAKRVHYTSLFRNKNGIWCMKGQQIYGIAKDSIFLLYEGLKNLSASYYYTVFNGYEYLLSGGYVYVGYPNGTKRILRLNQPEVIATTGSRNSIYMVGGNGSADSLYTYALHGDSVPVTSKAPFPAFCYELEYQSDASILCLTAKGTYIYDGRFRQYHPYKERIPFNRILHDREGNTWFGTLNNGVYLQGRHPASLFNTATGLLDNDVLAVCSQDSRNTLTACYNSGGFSLVEDGRTTNVLLPNSGSLSRTKFAYRLRNGDFLAGSDRGLYRIGAKRFARALLSTDAQKDCDRQGRRYYIAHSGGAVCYDDSTNIIYPIWRERTTAIAVGADKTVWLGTLNGLYCSRSGTISKFNQDSNLSSNRIVGLSYAGNARLAVATHRSGLYIWNGRRIQHIDRSCGLVSDNCSGLCADTDGTIWVCTDQGLDRISARHASPEIYHYSALDGLPDTKVNDVAISENRLYVATADGIIMLGKEIAPSHLYKAPKVYILSVGLHDSTISWPQEHLILPYKENSFQVNYTGLSLVIGSVLQYRYVLNGGNADTAYTRLGAINLSALKPGDYQLLVWAKHDAAGKWSSEPAILSFTIRPPFWLTPWFITLCACLLTVILYRLYMAKVLSIRQREKELSNQRHRMAALEMQALRAQINPHFMFNALNSIQHFYSQNEDRKANRYMGLFVQLIRKALHHAENHWLTLEEELKMLTAYLDLEQMRFKHAFTYEIAIDPGIDPCTLKIPAMLIQPYVENAIGHGLRPLRDRAGILKLAVRLEQQQVICSIDDNGIGITEGMRCRPPGHQSLGMDITRQRVETMNELYRTHIRVIVSDKCGQDSDCHGTLVVIHIPLGAAYA